MSSSVLCRLIFLLVIVSLSSGCTGGRVYRDTTGARMPDEDVAKFFVNLYVKSIIGDADKFEQPENCILSGFSTKLLPGKYQVTVGGNRHLVTLLVDAEAGHRYEVQYDREYLWRFSERGPYDLDHTWIEDTSTGRRVSDIHTERANSVPRRRMKAYPPDNYSYCFEVLENAEDYFYYQDDQTVFISQYNLEFSAGEIFYIYTRDEIFYKLVMIEADSTKIRAGVLQIDGLDTDSYVEEFDIDDIQKLEKIRPPPPKPRTEPKPGVPLLVELGSFVLGIVLGLALVFAL